MCEYGLFSAFYVGEFAIGEIVEIKPGEVGGDFVAVKLTREALEGKGKPIGIIEMFRDGKAEVWTSGELFGGEWKRASLQMEVWSG